MLFLPVWGPLRSVEAVVFVSAGSDGESVKRFMRGKRRETNSLILVGGNVEGRRRMSLNESHVLVSREAQKLCCHLTPRSISNRVALEHMITAERRQDGGRKSKLSAHSSHCLLY